jgi:hypothetical protein
MTCPICHRPQATPADEALWNAHQAGAPLPEGWLSEDAEHLCWHAVCGQGCAPDEQSDPVAVARRLIDEGADGAVLLVARAVVRLSAVLDAERGVKGLPGGSSMSCIRCGEIRTFRAARWMPWCSRDTSAPS